MGEHFRARGEDGGRGTAGGPLGVPLQPPNPRHSPGMRRSWGQEPFTFVAAGQTLTCSVAPSVALRLYSNHSLIPNALQEGGPQGHIASSQLCGFPTRCVPAGGWVGTFWKDFWKPIWQLPRE